jgi:hypothetical protein
VLCFVWSGLLLTGFTQQDDDADTQIHSVIRLNGCHRVMFKANITGYKEIGREGRNVKGPWPMHAYQLM